MCSESHLGLAKQRHLGNEVRQSCLDGLFSNFAHGIGHLDAPVVHPVSGSLGVFVRALLQEESYYGAFET